MKSILIANWKNFPGSLEEARVLVREISRKKNLFKKISLFVAPPLPYLALLSEKSGSYSTLGSQDFFPYTKGKFTGAVTGEILKSFGVKFSILGHSEMRALGETAETVSLKAKMALKSGLCPVICFGEKELDSDGGHFAQIERELKGSIKDISKKDTNKIILAYEPVWAIGKTAKDSIDPKDLSETVVFIKKILTDIYGRKKADEIRIIYGGSVEPENAGILLKNTGVKGFLVGHASLKPSSLEKITLSLIAK